MPTPSERGVREPVRGRRLDQRRTGGGSHVEPSRTVTVSRCITEASLVPSARTMPAYMFCRSPRVSGSIGRGQNRHGAHAAARISTTEGESDQTGPARQLAARPRAEHELFRWAAGGVFLHRTGRGRQPPATLTADTDRVTATICGCHQLRGVNLGGWFVVEPWMTPALFAGTGAVDEHTLMETPDGRPAVRRHRETFITEADFAWIAEHGLDLVRLPVGHWTLQAEPPYEAAVELLDAAMDWARRVRAEGAAGHARRDRLAERSRPQRPGRAARVLPDLAAPRGQLEALAQLATRYREHPALWGIELVNEPTDPRIWRLWEFHHRAYRRLTELVVPGTRVVFSDGYLPWSCPAPCAAGPDFPVVLDCHFYQAFFPGTAEVLRAAPGQGPAAQPADRLAAARQPVLVGEWSAAMDPPP